MFEYKTSMTKKTSYILSCLEDWFAYILEVCLGVVGDGGCEGWMDRFVLLVVVVVVGQWIDWCCRSNDLY